VKRTRVDEAWAGQAECTNCSIRYLALFADLKEADFNLIHLPIDEYTVSPGEPLYHAGDDGRAVFTLRRGLVKLVQYLADGGQRIVRLLRPGDTLALEVLVGRPYEHTAIVLRDALVCRIPREVVNRLSVETPRLHNQLMQRWYNSVRQADEWLTELSTGNAKARMARLLLSLADVEAGALARAGMAVACRQGGPAGPQEGAEEDDEPAVCELFSREDIGAMLGVTTETASRTIAEFRRLGVITAIGPNRFQCDLDVLHDLAGD
jgi:CRP-like cAMP-binding protein